MQIEIKKGVNHFMTDQQPTNPFPMVGMIVRLSVAILVGVVFLVGLHYACGVEALYGIGLLAGLLWVAMLAGLIVISREAKLGPWRLAQASIVVSIPRVFVCLLAVVINVKFFGMHPLWAVIDLSVLYFAVLSVEVFLIWNYVMKHKWPQTELAPKDGPKPDAQLTKFKESNHTEVRFL